MLYARSACIKRVLRVDMKHENAKKKNSLTYFHNYVKHELNWLKKKISAYYVFDFFSTFISFLLSFFQIDLYLVMI